MRAPLAATFFLAVCGISSAQELQVPYSGSTQQVAGDGGLSWTCDALREDGSIACNFVQMTIRKPDIPNREAEARKLLSAEFLAECSEMDTLLATMAGKASEPNTEGWIRESVAATAAAYKRLCAERSMEAAVGVVDLQQGIDRRTCNISSWPFALSFKRSEAGDKWDAMDGPRGACGILKVVSLVPDYALGAAVPLWNFQQRSIVTNPSGQDIAGRPCSEWQEERMEFSWKKRLVRPMCEFVKHGLF